MKIAVAGLWHTGTVTAACLASKGVQVVAYDDSGEISAARLPIFEPGLEELVRSQKNLDFTDDARRLHDVEGAWIAYDTPVDDHDEADVEFVVHRTIKVLEHLSPGAFVLISSQLPVGTTRRIAAVRRDLTVAYSPENLRLGKAIDAFLNPSRVVVGLADPQDRDKFAPLLHRITTQIEWMSIESAEMVKHALNSFLATCVTFANEIAVRCEKAGADAREVERGLRGDPRVGPKAYVKAGGAFAGGTLGRDLDYLMKLGPGALFPAVRMSNESHKRWPCQKLETVLGGLQGHSVALLGLTYTPGTSTLRRSASIEIGRWLGSQGAVVKAFDPIVKSLHEEAIHLSPSAEEALRGASAMIVGTECPEFLSLRAEDVVSGMKEPVVIDPGRFLEKNLGADPRIRYFAVGKPE